MHDYFLIHFEVLLGLVGVEPDILFDLLEAESEFWLCNQNVLNQVFYFVGEVASELVICRKDFLVQTLRVLILKRKMAADQTE